MRAITGATSASSCVRFRGEEHPEGSDYGDTPLAGYRPRVGNVREERRMQPPGERDGSCLAAVENKKEIGSRGRVVDSEPGRPRNLVGAGQARTGNDDLFEDDPRNHYLGVEKPEEFELAGPTQVDERSCVGNDDHTVSCASSSR